MEDVSEFFKSGFIDLYKNTIGKNYQQKTLRDRVGNFNNQRRETRNMLIFQKRQIDENMTPINTPEPSKIVKTLVEMKDVKKPIKRLEMLQKWKAEKEKRKQEAKQKAKPLFKVCHVPVEVGLPNLEDVNKKIKGKAIKANVSQTRSQFAPPNHAFHAPKAIKPIHMNSNTNLPVKSKIDLCKSNTRLNSLEKNKLLEVTHDEVIVPRRNTRATSRIQQLEKTDKKIHKSSNNKQKPAATAEVESKNVKSKRKETPLRDVKVENGTKLKQSSGQKSKNDKLVAKKQFVSMSSVSSSGSDNNKINCSVQMNGLPNAKKIPNKNKFTAKSQEKESLVKEHSDLQKSSKLSKKAMVKTVGWHCVDHNFSTDEDIKTPKTNKKKYKKTPRKMQKLDISDRESIDKSSNTDVEENTIQSIPKNAKKLKRQLRKSKSNPELKELGQPDQKESDIKSRNSTIGSATGSASPDYPIDTNTTEINNCFRTPEKNNVREDSPVYVSPFVTVSRGKSSARKEYHQRKSAGCPTPELGVDVLNSTSPKAGADYFLKKLNNEILRIEAICDTWECYKNSNELPEEANDMINVAIGQSKLLISKKFEQFRNLIQQCKKCEYVEKPVSCEDLHGFWDMVYMQVEDLNKRFQNLDTLKANNWQEIIPEKKTVVKRGRGRPKKASASAALKNLIKAARNMKNSNPESENTLNIPQTDETKVFNGGYYSVKSPIRTSTEPLVINKGSGRRSLRVSLLTNQAKKRMSSPGLTMMKLSQAIKHGDGITPSKSILKNDLTKSEKRVTKSVLFRDNLEEDIDAKLICFTDDSKKNIVNKENNINEVNLISFSPVTPTRRSKRLTKVE